MDRVPPTKRKGFDLIWVRLALLGAPVGFLAGWHYASVLGLRRHQNYEQYWYGSDAWVGKALAFSGVVLGVLVPLGTGLALCLWSRRRGT